MDRAAKLVLIVSALTVFLSGVEGTARVCYFGPPPKPDPDNPDHWMKQVMREIRERCPGKRGRSPAEAGPTEPGTTAVGCSTPRPLGMEDGTIPDERISASSYQTFCFGSCLASDARLNSNERWAPNSNRGSWIEVDLAVSTLVSGVITQGGPGGIRYVKRYLVSYQRQHSSDRVHVTDGNDEAKVFTGNSDGNTPVTNMFKASVLATTVRIEPTEWHHNVGLRFELLGCRLD
ncbi:lactadherin-like [Acanthaster planci]|uniref:Lactadherin-like n=1 Tax=Acanthaster planci TaxID=133434 RepID=A0A8B7XSD3_ACAPL|nr:lactadherin-like [Acanthaster planci]